jgi:hypothetical protein
VWDRVAVSDPGEGRLSKVCTLVLDDKREIFEEITFTYVSRNPLN